MPQWAQLVSTFAALGLAVGWLAWRWGRPGRTPTCSSCAAAMPPATGQGRRSPRLKVLG